MPIDARNALAACELFAELSAPGLRDLAAQSRVRQLSAGENLFHHGQSAEGFYVVAVGCVRVYRIGADGRQQVLHRFGPGETVGEVAVFEGRDFPASAEAEGKAAVVYLQRERFLSVGRRDPEILLTMLATLSARLRRLVGLVDDLALKDVGARLAQYLLNQSDGQTRVALSVSKGTLAAQIGTVAATLSRTLKKLQGRGMLAVEGKTIDILDREALEALLEQGGG